MAARRVLPVASVAVATAVAAFLYLASSPRWVLVRFGPYEILAERGSLFEWVRNEKAVTAEERGLDVYSRHAGRTRGQPGER